MIGSLIYASQACRPDIAFGVSYLSRFMSRPNTNNFTQAMEILKYLKGTPTTGLFYKSNQLNVQLHGFVDASWSEHCNVSGYVFYHNGVISWSSKKQESATISSTEAEIVAASCATQEAMFLKHLFNSIGEAVNEILLHMDNISTKAICEGNKQSSKLKHVIIRDQFVTQAVQRQDIKLEYVESTHNHADVLTKVKTGKGWHCIIDQMMS